MFKFMKDVENSVKKIVKSSKAVYYEQLSKFQQSKAFDDANALAHSKWYDLVGCAIVIFGFIVAHYFNETLYTSNAWKWGMGVAHNPISIAIASVIPFGFISLISALNSLLSDRLEARLSNLGNWISIPSVVLSAYVDSILGNRASYITYSLTFVFSLIAPIVWHFTGKYNVNKPVLHGWKAVSVLVGLFIASFAFSYWADILGYGTADAHGAIFWTSTLAFAISIIANLAEMFKYKINNQAWMVYNVVQIIKAVAQKNIPYVFKYLYYMVNTGAALTSWSDKGRAVSRKADTARKAVKA